MKLVSTILLTFLSTMAAFAQVGIKTNLLYDATATVNLGVEVPVAPKWSIDVSGNLNAWDINDHKWKHWLAQPEARYWFCRALSGHFVGLHLLGGQYNFGNLNTDFKFLGSDFSVLKDHRVQGWYAGAGLAYGYTWLLARHWSMEAEIGVGYAYTRYDQYPCASCGTREIHNRQHNYFGLTKAAINLIYVF